MSPRTRLNLEKALALVERRFDERLRAALLECASGKWGLFGRNDAVIIANFGKNAIGYLSEDARELMEMIGEIGNLRSRLGYSEPHDLCARFLSFRARRSANDPGEPKLAIEFLAEMDAVK